MPSITFGVHSVMDYHAAIRLLNIRKLFTEKLMELRDDGMRIVPKRKKAAQVTAGLETIARILKRNKAITKIRKDEFCRLASELSFKPWKKLKRTTPVYSRDIRKILGIPFFGTHCVGWTQRPDGQINIILGISVKEDSPNEFDFTFGGNLDPKLTPLRNLDLEGRQETKIIRLSRKGFFRHRQFSAKVKPLIRDLRTIKHKPFSVRVGRREIYSLELPYGIEHELVPNKKEHIGFISVPLNELLEAWRQGDEHGPYALKYFKHAVPIAIVAFALENKLVKLTARQRRQLKSAIREKKDWYQPPRPQKRRRASTKPVAQAA